MRWSSFARNGKATFGFVTDDDHVVDVGANCEHETLKDAIAADDLLRLSKVSDGTTGLTFEEVEFLPTVTNPDKILCVGLNYRDHQAETGRGGEDNPTIFVRFAAAQVGHRANMVRPKESKTLDFEGEIALIIGKHARRIESAKWLEYVAGFSCYNDGSVREFQRHTSQFTPGKNFTGTGGFGPWMMTAFRVLARMKRRTKSATLIP